MGVHAGPMPSDAIEQLAYDRLAKEVDWPLLVQMAGRLASECPFYSTRLSHALGGSGRLESWAQFQGLPFTSKGDVLREQELNPPFGRFLGTGSTTSAVRVHRTSGTAGRGLYIAMSQADANIAVTAGRRAFICAGAEAADRIVHCLNYCLWAGGVTDHLSLEATGAAVIPFGVGQSRRLIETIKRLAISAISCTPSYMVRLQAVMQDELGEDPRQLGLRKAFFGGEGGLQNPAVRGHIEEVWGLQAIDANYGMADVLSIFGAECAHRTGLHFHGQGIVHLELVNPDSGRAVPVAHDAIGELVLTNLTREIQPLLRYRTGDVVKMVGVDTCACGRRSPRFIVLGRSDQMVVVRGANVFPSAIKDVLLREPIMFSGEFQLVLPTPPPHDRVQLRVEVRDRACLASGDAGASLLAALQEELSFSPLLDLVPVGTLPRTEGKTTYVVRAFED
jgi:phenylacetate-CoA ligase